MTATILTISMIVLAAFFKAVADTLTHHYDTSVFKWWDKRFWDPSVSWQYAHYITGTKYKVDGWHLANTCMIICFCLAVVLHHSLIAWYWELLIGGAVFNGTFNLFYNKILRLQ